MDALPAHLLVPGRLFKLPVAATGKVRKDEPKEIEVVNQNRNPARRPVSPRYPEMEVQGDPVELGRGVGEAAREQIGGFVDLTLERLDRFDPVSRDAALAIAKRSFEHVAEYAPRLLEELRGMAEGARVGEQELMLLQVRNQLTPADREGCTSFAVSPAVCAEHHAVVAQNWDNDPALDPFTIVITRRPAGKPAHMSLTQAGLIGYIGFNEAGVGLCLNTLQAPSRARGVPHYFIIRKILEATSLDAVIEAVQRAERAIPANIMLTTPEGPADLEVTLDDIRVLRNGDSGIVTHTNHCIHPALRCFNDQFPELMQSHDRLRRIDELFRSTGRPVGVPAMQEMLRDRKGAPRSICRWPSSDAETGHLASVFSVLIEADGGCMHVTRGNPCEAPYETYRMTPPPAPNQRM